MSALWWLAVIVTLIVLTWRVLLEDRAILPVDYRRHVGRSTFPLRRHAWFVSRGPAPTSPLISVGAGFTFSRFGALLASARCARRHRCRFVNGLESGYLVTKRRLSAVEADRLRAVWIRDHAARRPIVLSDGNPEVDA